MSPQGLCSPGEFASLICPRSFTSNSHFSTPLTSLTPLSFATPRIHFSYLTLLLQSVPQSQETILLPQVMLDLLGKTAGSRNVGVASLASDGERPMSNCRSQSTTDLKERTNSRARFEFRLCSNLEQDTPRPDSGVDQRTSRGLAPAECAFQQHGSFW